MVKYVMFCLDELFSPSKSGHGTLKATVSEVCHTRGSFYVIYIFVFVFAGS